MNPWTVTDPKPLLTEEEGRKAAQDLLGAKGDCWSDGYCWLIGTRTLVQRMFLGLGFGLRKRVYIWGRHQTIEEALLDAEENLRQYRKRQYTLSVTALRARSGLFKPETP